MLGQITKHLQEKCIAQRQSELPATTLKSKLLFKNWLGVPTHSKTLLSPSVFSVLITILSVSRGSISKNVATTVSLNNKINE